MNDETKIKVQAYLDGELSGRDAADISELLQEDAEAKAFLAELQFVKNALHGNELEIKLPESREFYWGKIEREIQREAKKTPARISVFAWWKPAYVRLAGGVAAACALMMVSFIAFDRDQQVKQHVYVPGEVEGSVEMGAITFHSSADQMTVVYLFDRESGDVLDSKTN